MNLPVPDWYQLNDNLMFDYHYQNQNGTDEWDYKYGVTSTGWMGDMSQIPGLFAEHPAQTLIECVGSITPLII